jgi:hypothetical protein
MNLVERDRVDRVMEQAQRQIWVTFRKEGIHKYPAALTDPGLADVQFLGYPHPSLNTDVSVLAHAEQVLGSTTKLSFAAFFLLTSQNPAFSTMLNRS